MVITSASGPSSDRCVGKIDWARWRATASQLRTSDGSPTFRQRTAETIIGCQTLVDWDERKVRERLGKQSLVSREDNAWFYEVGPSASGLDSSVLVVRFREGRVSKLERASF